MKSWCLAAPAARRCNCNRRRSVRHRGFTLLEVLIGVLITSFMLVIIYGSLSRTLNSKAIAEERAELFALGRDAVMRMADEIETALPPAAGDSFFFRGTNSSGKMPVSKIEFISMNRGGYGEGRMLPGHVLISYSLDPIRHQRGLFSLRRDQWYFAALLEEAQNKPSTFNEEEFGPTWIPYYLLTCPKPDPDSVGLPGGCVRVLGLQFRYYDAFNSAWAEEWDSTKDPTFGRIPHAVEVLLYLADDRGQVKEFKTIVDIPMASRTPPAIAAAGQPVTRPGSFGASGNDSGAEFDPNDLDPEDME